MRLERSRARRKIGARLAHELTTAEGLQPRLTASRLGAYAIATLVFLLTLAFGIAGVVLTVVGARSGNVVEIVLGLFLIGVAWFMRPRLGRVPKDDVVSRNDAPALYELTDRVAAALGVRPIDVLIVDEEWNASWSTVGLRRRRVLTLGLPLFYALDRQQQVALVGHELAHARNSDSTRGLFVGSAINGLDELCAFLSHEGPEDAEGITLIVKPILWLVSRPPYWLLRLQVNLARHDAHRAEYLADALAARVAGSEAVVGLHERTLLYSTFEIAVHRASQPNAVMDGDLFDDLARAINAAPAREVERRRRVARLEESRLDATHPPMGMRIELLEKRPTEEALLRLLSEAAAIDAELRPLREALHRRLVQAYRSSLYYG